MNRWIPAVAALAVTFAAVGAAAQVDGTLDPGFGGGGTTRIAFDLPDSTDFDRPTAVGVDAAGRIVVAGLAASYDGSHATTSGAIVRLTAAGAIDPGFGAGGRLVWADDIVGSAGFDGLDLLVLPEGGVVVAGERWLGGESYQLFVRWYDPNGSLLGEYTNAVAAWAADARLARDPATGWALVAYSDEALGDRFFRCFRLRPDLLVDPNFGVDGFLDVVPPVAASQMPVEDLVAFPDGRVLVAGSLKYPLGGGTFFAAVVNADGLGLQSSFGAGGFEEVTVDLGAGQSARLRAAAVDAQGRVLLAGEAQGTAFGGGDRAAVLVRRTATGGPDASFNGGDPLIVADTSGWDAVFGVAVQSDGRILVAGRVNGAASAMFYAARYEPDGQADWSFGSFGAFSANFPFSPDEDFATGLALQDGRPLLVGPAEWSLTDYDFGVMRLTNALVFADDLERGTTDAWSARTP